MGKKPDLVIVGPSNSTTQKIAEHFRNDKQVIVVDAATLLGPKFDMDFDPDLIALDVARRHGGMASASPKPTKTPDEETEEFLAESFNKMFPTTEPKGHLDLLAQRDVVVSELLKKRKPLPRKRRAKK